MRIKNVLFMLCTKTVTSLHHTIFVGRGTSDSIKRGHNSNTRYNTFAEQEKKTYHGVKLNRDNMSVITLRGGSPASAATSAFSSSPPLGSWITPALICALSYAMYNLSIKKASSSIDHMLGGVFLQVVAATLGGMLFAIKIFVGQGSSIVTQKSGVIWSIVAGLAVGAAEILSFYVSSKGVQAMQSIPVIVGGSVLLGTLLGRVWLKEVISTKAWIGVFLISIGIGLTASS